ncbi:PAS domain-containing sensor histidine kinase [Nocardioidaceae bacterium]|nr:PAS domain-containing sensor histidine kinase [Nocardioidaceae bacterium]
MSAMVTELVRGGASPADADWLQRLVAQWQVVSDLSFADLVLWTRQGGAWRAVAQVRPTTAPTAYVEDLVGSSAPPALAALLHRAEAEGTVLRQQPVAGEIEDRADSPRALHVEAVPVRRPGGAVAAVATRATGVRGTVTPSPLERSYLATAGDLVEMMTTGAFPPPGTGGTAPDSPRVGDGFVRLGPDARVTYASPNAQSVFRRLGLAADLQGHHLPSLTRTLVAAERRDDEERLGAVMGGRVAADLEIGDGVVSLAVHSVPLRTQAGDAGSLLLVRDVTDLRRRDRELLSKEATIREIHHRVKNNLQTVAALLRLQARRLDGPGRGALEEAVRRVGSIALVHETLSLAPEERVAFDEVADRLRAAVTDMTSRGAVTTHRTGSFGEVGSAQATALAMVLTELLANAFEHGFGAEGAGHVELRAARVRRRSSGDPVVPARGDTVIEGVEELVVEVVDDGVGLPADLEQAAAGHLGLSIVRTLVDSELRGTFTLDADDGGGTIARVVVPL